MIVVHPAVDFARVKSEWCALAQVARHSFFLSWPWISTWLRTLPKRVKPQLFLIVANGRTIGAALMVRRTLLRRLFLPVRTWALNSAGDAELDQIFIEHNGLLCRPEDAKPAWTALANEFVHQRSRWDEIQLRGVAPHVLEAWTDQSTSFEEDMSLVGRYVDLAAMRSSGGRFVDTLSKKKRARIRHTSVRLLQSFGPLSVNVAREKDEAFAFLSELEQLHQAHWIGRSRRGAFAGEFFKKFHARLIKDHFDSGCVQLLRLRAGNQTIGVLYNFVHQGEVSVYVTGINYAIVEFPNKESPGLLTHVLAIDFNASLGHSKYDLLAGDSDYKRALAKRAETLWWGRVQRERAKFRVEATLRNVWRTTKAMKWCRKLVS